MEKIQWKVEGMDCSNCALTIRKYLEKQGMKDVKVNFATGDVSFDMNGNGKPQELAIGIKDLGYKVANQQLRRSPDNRQPETFSFHSSSAFLVLPSLYGCIDAAHDSRRSYSLADESLGTIGFNYSCFYCWYEFFWKKCMEKSSQWHAQYECADSNWRHWLLLFIVYMEH